MAIIPTDRKVKTDVADSAPLDKGDVDKKQPKQEIKLNKDGDVLVNDPTLPKYEEKVQPKMKSFNEFCEALTTEEITPVQSAAARQKLKQIEKSGVKKSQALYDKLTRLANAHPVKEEVELEEAQYGVNLGSRPVSGQKEYQGKEIKSFHPNKEKEAREFADKHGYVVKKNMLPAGNSITHTWDIHKEEVEQVDEISKHTLQGYVSKAAISMYDKGLQRGTSTWKKTDGKKLVKRLAGIQTAAKKLAKEEVDQEVVSELHASTLQSYMKKAGANIRKKSIERTKANSERRSAEVKAGTRQPGELSDGPQHTPSDKENKLTGEINKRHMNIKKAEHKVWVKNTTPEKNAARVAASNERQKQHVASMRSVDRIAGQLAKQRNEEVEQIDEISKETLKSYIPKAIGSKEGADWARGVKMGMGVDRKGEDELRAKSMKRGEGIATAIKKLTKEAHELEEAYLHDPDTYLRMATQAREQGKILRAALLTRIAAAVRRKDLATAMTLRRSLPATQE